MHSDILRSIIEVLLSVIAIIVIIFVCYHLFFSNKNSHRANQAVTITKSSPVVTTMSNTVQTTPIVTSTPNLSKALLGKWTLSETIVNNQSVELAEYGYSMSMYYEFKEDNTYVGIMTINGETHNEKGSYSLSGNTLVFSIDNSSCIVTIQGNKLHILYADSDNNMEYVFIRTTTAPIAPTPTNQINYIKVTAYQLYKDYEENVIAADKKYLNNYIEVTGKITSISKLLGKYYVSLDADGYGIDTIECIFGQSQVNALTTIKTGQHVTIRGVCEGMSLLSIYVNNCQLVR